MSRNQFFSSDLIHEEDEEEELMREQLFEKPLTPSDVGKLNRLVIPKQHAEKYFPLRGDSLLSFEDESGKSWRFRYSYWNSSQSYVLTKGWSRFVKEKRLDAGDIVMFQRRCLDGELCISWKRRSTATTTSTTTTTTTTTSVHDRELSHQVVPNPPWTQAFYNAQFSYPSHPHHHQHQHQHQHHMPMLYQPACLHAVEPVTQTVPMTTTVPVNSKRLRLFGVNLDCQIDDSDQPMSDSSSSTGSLLSQGRAQMAYSQGHGPDHNSYYYQY